MRAASAFAFQRTQGGPLAVTLGVHLLLAWWWLQAPRPVAPDNSAAPREFFLVPLLQAPEPELELDLEPEPEPEPASRPALPPSAARSRARPAAPVAAPQAITPPTVTDPVAVPEAAPQSGPEPVATPVPDTGAAAAGESVAARARRAAGSADQALRTGKLAPLSEDARGQRLASAFDAAHNDTSRNLVSESYTAPDGQIIYRFRIGTKVFCRTSGHVRPSLGGAAGGGATLFDGAGGGGAAGIIRCTTHAGFKRD